VILALICWQHSTHSDIAVCCYNGNILNVCAQERCRISPPRFLAECHKRRLNQCSFCIAVFCVVYFSGLCLVCIFSVIFNLSSVLYFPM